MLKVVWNIFKYVIGTIFSVFRPLKRLICQRRKSSESDGSELTSVGTGGLILLETLQAYPQDGDGEIDMESWDMWDSQSQSVTGYKPPQAAVHPSQQFAHASSQGHKGEVQMNGFSQQKHPQGYNGSKIDTQNVQMDPEINFFEDMTPQVKRQPKILIRKKDSSQPSGGSLSNRLAVLSDVPFSNSELEAWEEQANAWDTEVASDDLIWQAEEAIKETRRKERMERHVEQQKKKQKKDEMRVMKSGSLLATKIS